MNHIACGIVGLFLGICVVLTGTVGISMNSFFFGILYLIISGICAILVTNVFCTKCPIKTSCVHVLPGFIARIWPEKKGPYTTFDLLLTIILFAIIILPPQVFLIAYPGLFVFFWICMILAAICSNRFLCPDCKNQFCPFCRK